MPKVYTLYLSTQTPAGFAGAPLDATNKANVRWSINWDALLGFPNDRNTERLTKVTFQFETLSQASVYTYANNSGYLAIAGLSNKFCNCNNGLFLGAVQPLDNPVAGNPNHILFGDTLQTRGVTTYIPYGVQEISVLIEDRTGALQSNVLDYQLILQFEMEEDPWKN
jgi:hypothetical protein